MIPSEEIYILSVYRSGTAISDLRDILDAINTNVVVNLTWGIAWLEWFGAEDADEFNKEIDTAAGQRILISGKRLVGLAQSVTKVIEGTFVGYRSDDDAKEFLEANWSLTQFRTSLAEIALVAVDGCWFDVYLRTRAYVDQLVQHFADVRWQDPHEFLQ